MKIVDVHNENGKNGDSYLDSGRPSSINSEEPTVNVSFDDEDDDLSAKSFKVFSYLLHEYPNIRI